MSAELLSLLVFLAKCLIVTLFICAGARIVVGDWMYAREQRSLKYLKILGEAMDKVSTDFLQKFRKGEDK